MFKFKWQYVSSLFSQKWKIDQKEMSAKYKNGLSNLLVESFVSTETAVGECRLILERILKFNKRWSGRAVQVIVRVPVTVLWMLSVLITDETVSLTGSHLSYWSKERLTKKFGSSSIFLFSGHLMDVWPQSRCQLKKNAWHKKWTIIFLQKTYTMKPDLYTSHLFWFTFLPSGHIL